MCSIQYLFHKDALACGGVADLHIGDCAHGAAGHKWVQLRATAVRAIKRRLLNCVKVILFCQFPIHVFRIYFQQIKSTNNHYQYSS